MSNFHIWEKVETFHASDLFLRQPSLQDLLQTILLKATLTLYLGKSASFFVLSLPVKSLLYKEIKDDASGSKINNPHVNTYLIL